VTLKSKYFGWYYCKTCAGEELGYGETVVFLTEADLSTALRNKVAAIMAREDTLTLRHGLTPDFRLNCLTLKMQSIDDESLSAIGQCRNSVSAIRK
jgi:hypothetical protein